MQRPEAEALRRRILSALSGGLKSAMGKTWRLLSVLLPASLATRLLDWFGLLDLAGDFCAPLLNLVGLPGEAVFVLAASIFGNLFAAIGVATSIGLNFREMTILAVACLVAHNLVAETASMRKAGSYGSKMVVLRLFFALGLAILLDFLLPEKLGLSAFSSGLPSTHPAFGPMMGSWALGALGLSATLILVILAVFAAERLLEEFHAVAILSRILAPFMKFLGLPAESSRLWLVTNIVGYSEAGAIIAGEIEAGKKKPQEGDLFNHGAAFCHSLLEETALFAVLGLSLFWLVLPRLALSVALVWIERVRRHYFRRSFRAGIT